MAIEEKTIPVAEIEYKEKFPEAHEIRARKYAEMIRAGHKFLPISVFGKRFENDTYQVFDGHARVLAHKLLGLTEIEAIVSLVDKNGKSISCKKKGE